MRLLATTAALVVAGAALIAATSGAAPAVYAATINPTPKAVWNPAEYDGAAMTTDAPDLDGLPDVHGVYIYPSDQPSRFGKYAAYFQAEQKRASTLLSSATGMGFRWDERVSKNTDGTTRLLHDITVVKAKANLRSLSSSKQFGLIGDALRAAGPTDPNKKYYVWLDAKSVYCGQGRGNSDTVRAASNAANSTGYAASYRPTGGEEMYAANGGWCNPVTHELLHTFGAVNPAAPHWISGGHCNDDAQDVMCDTTQGPEPFDANAPRTIDTNNDDYLDPSADLALPDGAGKLTNWTVNLSRFLCPRSTIDRTRPDCGQANNPAY